MLTESLVIDVARECGLALLGVIDRDGFARSVSSQLGFLRQWQQSGYAGEMRYMNRPPELFADLDKFLPGVQSLVLVAVPYSEGPPPPSPHGAGRVARYAWGRDYHVVLRERLGELGKKISGGGNKRSWRAFSDSVPLLERSLGAAAALGFVGKNSLLIRPGLGSYFFLGELLLTDPIVPMALKPEVTGARGRLAVMSDPGVPGSGCGSCDRCLVQCPTTAFVGDGVLDSRRCISYLTIEKRGEFSQWERQAISDWIFGCDVCQEVCPFNATNSDFSWREFSASAGVGPYLALDQIFRISTAEEFESLFGKTAISRAKREGLIRNACAVAANTHCFELVEALGRLMKEDISQVIRAAATQALLDLELEAEGVDRVRIKSALVGGGSAY